MSEPNLTLTLLSGCFGSMAFLGSASTTAASGASGNIARGAFTSTVSYGIKKTTGNSLPIRLFASMYSKWDKRKGPTKTIKISITFLLLVRHIHLKKLE